MERVTRRNFLKLIAGAAALAATGCTPSGSAIETATRVIEKVAKSTDIPLALPTNQEQALKINPSSTTKPATSTQRPNPTATEVPKSPTASKTPEPPTPVPREPLPQRANGLQIPSYQAGEYQKDSTGKSFNEAVKTVKPNFIVISTTQYQENIYATSMFPTERTATDKDLISAINKAHSLDCRVILMPKLDLLDNIYQWHGRIGENFSEAQWQTWFRSYRDMIYHYADLAQQTGVEMFIVGNEYKTTAPRTDDWITTIKAIRQRYSGPLTYAAHMDELETINWWQHLDFIGINPYYELTNEDYPSIEELVDKWSSIADRFQAVAYKYQKKILIPEIGYASVKGANRHPWDFRLSENLNLPSDEKQQADCLRAMYAALWPRFWFYGACIWFWDIKPNAGGINDKTYAINNKDAAAVVRLYSDSISQGITRSALFKLAYSLMKAAVA